MRSVHKTREKHFRLSFSTGGSSRKGRDFDWIASRNSQSKNVESKKHDCVRKPDLGFSGERPFLTDKSNCIRNGIRA